MPASYIQRTMRHALAAGIAVALLVVFLSIRADFGVHAMNRSLADAAFVLLIVTMALGPLAKLAPGLRRLLTWRHEFGVWTVIMAFGHLYVILDGWVRWDIAGFYLVPWERAHGVEVIDRSFLMGNVLGFLALAYGVILLATSNRWALKKLGKSWRYVQTASRIYVLLIVVHTAYFLFWHYSIYPDAEPGLFSLPFLLLTASLYILIVLGFFATVHKNKRPMVPAKERAD